MSERSDAVVLFGATGDLARKKLFPALYHLRRAGRLSTPVMGVASRPWTQEQLADHARESIEAHEAAPDRSTVDALLADLSYVSGDYRKQTTYDALAERLAGRSNPLFYLAIPPDLFDDVVSGLAACGIAGAGRVVVEKPFGRDLVSSRELDECLHRVFPEDRIFRIDHYLGKESVESVLVFRFANSILEPIWNRSQIQRVEITMMEPFGVEGRGRFYDEVGALRDVLQNHLLQLVAILAMEPPVAAHADAFRDERVKVLRAARAIQPEDVVRGQYHGYLEEDGVAPGSDTETFVAARLWIDSWRWAGVPFVLRTGKKLRAAATEAVAEFNQAPRLLFASHDAEAPHPNHLRFRFGGNDGVTLSVATKQPGDEMMSRVVNLSVSYADTLGERWGAYERLLDDAMDGDAARFARADSVDEAWRIVQPVLDDPPPVVGYAPGTWGPAEAEELLDGGLPWHEPEVSG